MNVRRGAALFLLCAAATAGAAAPATTAPAPLPPVMRAQRVTEIRQGIATAIAGFWRAVQRGQPSIRDLPNAALTILVNGGAPAEAQKALRLAFSFQDMDEKSAHYGSVPWQAGHPEIVDLNADEFTSQALGPIWLHYGTQLGDGFKQEMRPHLQAFLAAMARRQMRDPSYTNIFLMRAVNTILLGEILGDTAAADRGYGWLDDWIAYTQRCGIHEFSSPTYYCTDLNSLTMGYAYAARPGARAKFKTILDYFWTDIAANYMPQRGCIAGPNSRNYSFLESYSGVDLYLYLHGFRNTLNIPRPDVEKIYSVEPEPANTYQPGPAIYQLANEPQRIIRSRWDTDPSRDRYSFLTPGFEIGCANGDYGAQDKLLTVELASAKPHFPVIAVIPDVFDAPYGQTRTPDHSGHMKPTHLKLHPAVVQDKGVLLALLDLNPAETKAPIASLATNILLPAQADALLLDGHPVAKDGSLGPGLNTPAQANCVVAVREGGSGVAIRIFHADTCAGQELHSAVKTDEAGIKVGAARLAIYHYQGTPVLLPDTHVHVGLLLLAEPCADDAALAALSAKAQAAAITDHTDKAAWSVTAQVGPTTLAAATSLSKNKPPPRQVNGLEVQAGILNVNGVDWAAKLWGTPAK